MSERWIERWLETCADLAELERSNPMTDAVVDEIDGRTDLWAVGAKRIQVAQIPFPDGEKLEFSQHGDERELRVDGEPSDAADDAVQSNIVATAYAFPTAGTGEIHAVGAGFVQDGLVVVVHPPRNHNVLRSR